jgi:hypothetical protein
LLWKNATNRFYIFWQVNEKIRLNACMMLTIHRLWTIGGAPSSKCIRRSVSISRPLTSARGICDHSSAVSRSTLIAAFQSPRPCTRSAASDSAVGRSSFSWHTLALTASLGVALEAATSLPAVAAEVVLDSAAPHHSQLMWQVRGARQGREGIKQEI